MATETTERGSVEEKVRILFPYLITLKTSLLVVVALSTKFQKEVCLNSLKTETNITCNMSPASLGLQNVRQGWLRLVDHLSFVLTICGYHIIELSHNVHVAEVCL